jgi:hypothetical protein
MTKAGTIRGICIEPHYHDRESVKAGSEATMWGLEVISIPDPDPRLYVPVGGVDYCEKVLGRHPVPYYYPDWARAFMHRRTWSSETGEMPCFVGLFLKSCLRYKHGVTGIYRPYEDLYPERPFVASEVVEFTQEWRYYVADGEVLTTGWYDGDDDDEPAPEIDVPWPKGWCGAADFGRLSTGEMALVECQHPYACGWYGDDHGLFLMWLILGWEYMLRESANV